MSKGDFFVSVVMVTANDAAHIEGTLVELHSYLNEHFVDYEIVIVDQHSQDGTSKLIEHQLTRLTALRLIELAFPVAFDVAVAAGLENAIGDFVVILAPGKDPVNCIYDLVEQCKTGSDIVIGVAPQKFSASYRLLRPLVQRLLRAIGYDLPRNATNLRCLSRRTVNAVTKAGRFHHQLFVRMQKTGYPYSAYAYKQTSKAVGKSLYAGLREATRLLVFNSTEPLRWMSGIGVTISAVAFFISMYKVISEMIIEQRMDNSAFILLFASVMFMTLFTMLAYFGEYLGRLLDDRGEQFCYSVVYEKNSSVMLNENRVNVTSESEVENVSPKRKVK